MSGNGSTFKVALEPCDDILMSMDSPNHMSAKAGDIGAFGEPSSDVKMSQMSSDDDRDQWWEVHDWDGGHESVKLLRGEVAVMRVDNVHLILDSSLPLLMAPSGTFEMTTYRLRFLPKDKHCEASGVSAALCSAPLAMVERIEKIEGRWDRSNSIEIHTRDYRFLRLEFPRGESMLERAYQCLVGYVFPQKIDFLFGFFYCSRKTSSIPSHLDGWALYDGLKELLRLGIPSELLRITSVNKQFEVCDSYPSLVAVPAFVSDFDIKKVAAFRKRGRFPILSWKHPTSNASIWRCSQPRVGWNQSRSSYDEGMLSAILRTNPGQESLPIFDCRPKMNAVGNKLAGAGFELSEFYPDCSLTFLNIQNIHSVRDSAQKLAKLCRYEGTASSMNTSQFMSRLDASAWLSHQSDLVRAVLAGVQCLNDHQQTVLIHCSDGWDRTTQISSLIMLCLDPFYRTYEGFMILIEKEWLACGHKFAERIGMDADHSNSQRAPVFLQFIETTWQLCVQFPTEFEFNTKYLLSLMDHVWSGRFGTFFCNSIRERIQCCLRQRTVSLWTYMRSPESRMLFTNPLYEGADHVIYPSASTSKIRLWEEFWLRSGLVEYPRPLRLDALPPRAAHPVSTSTEMLYQSTIWRLKQQIQHLNQICKDLRSDTETVVDDNVEDICEQADDSGSQQTQTRLEREIPQLDRFNAKNTMIDLRQPSINAPIQEI